MGARFVEVCRATTFALVACAIAGASTAHAEPSSTNAAREESPKDKARALFREGALAVEQGRPADGVKLLEQAEALFHAPTHVLYLARGLSAMGQLRAARSQYERLVGEKLPPEASPTFREAQANGQKELDELVQRIPTIALTVEPASLGGVLVQLDGADVTARVSSGKLEVDPGPHSLEATAVSGARSDRVSLRVVERTNTEVTLVLRMPGAATEGESSGVRRRGEAERESAGWGPFRIAGVALLGVGGGGLVAGGVLAGLSASRQADADRLYASCLSFPCAQESEVRALDEQAAGLGTGGAVALIGGGALAITGLVLTLVGDEAEAESTVARVTVEPLFGGLEVTAHF